MNKKKIIAIYDSNWHGHHPTYLKLISRIILEKNYILWILCQNTEEIATWLESNTLGFDTEKIKFFSLKPMHHKNIFTIPIWSLLNWIQACKAIKKLEIKTNEKPDLVFFLKIDDFNKLILFKKIIDKIFPYQWVGLNIFLNFNINLKIPFTKKIFYPQFSTFYSKNCKKIAILQEDCAEKLQTIIEKPVIVLPDITDTAPPIKTNLIEQILTQANGRKIIGLIGGQDKRKGSFTLFKIAKECKHKNWFFLFVGRFNSDKSDKELKKLKNLISKEKNLSNCFFHFHRIPNENEFNSLISICNVIFAVYHNFYCSSNIMTKAAIFKKPIIVNKYGLMAKRVKKYNTGIVCNEKNISDCIKAISEVLNDKQTIRNYSLYSNDHSQVKFISQIEYLINSNH